MANKLLSILAFSTVFCALPLAAQQPDMDAAIPPPQTSSAQAAPEPASNAEDTLTPRVAASAARTQNACSTDAYGRAAASVVRVVSGQEHGSGVAIAPRLVVTAASIIRRGAGVHILGADGTRHEATVSAIDARRGLALLEVETNLPPIARASTSLGDRVAVLGLGRACSHNGAPEPALEETTVAGLHPDHIRLGALANHTQGSAILNCNGQLVGLLVDAQHHHGRGMSVGVPSVWVSDLADAQGRDRGYSGTWGGTMGIAALMQFEPNTRELVGFNLSLGITAWDWAMFMVRGAYLKGGETPGGVIAHREFERYRLDPLLAGRIYVNINEWLGFHIEIGAGASFAWSILHQDRAMVSATLPNTVEFARDRLERFAVRPTGYLGLLLGNLEVSYQPSIDLETSEARMIHTLGIGLRSN